MKKNIIISVSVCLLLMLTGCIQGLDNYDAPNGGIKGLILDEETNNPIPLPVQGSTGVIVKMYEQNTNAKQSVDFYAKYDGSYENSKIFNTEYKVVVDGPFVEPCEGTIKVNGATSFDLRATPFSRIEASANYSEGIITIQYEVKPTNNSFTVDNVFGYWNFAPGVDDGAANYAKKVTTKDSKGQISFDLKNDNAFKSNEYKIISNGNKIYVRIGAAIKGKINYSTIIAVQL
ncbi:DUF3823 domain-containing protein [Proteiniphilum acetatigenes]|uniref:DUF3823 domain-containing protein n=1 Tax=Proteiniphilum acetatigenes TaxID=294710 RepID=UPI000378C3D5|nr:DUF3823 domain-containing protein [Proteiniphilum acetatigenes]SFK40449.1 Protein of unknown function [Porphyromonadaceae bacterium KH3CP3RA]